MTQSKPARHGYRGYISARIALGRSTPQHIQQLVMRHYCAERNLTYLIAAVEYCMPGSTMILDDLLQQLDTLEGIVAYSLGLLPTSRQKRYRLYRTLFDHQCTLHLAVERLVISNWAEAQQLEESWIVHDVIKHQHPQELQILAAWDQANN